MRFSHKHVVLIPLALGLFSGGCTLGPDPTLPPTTAADAASGFVNTRSLTTTDASPSRWWESFADPITTELVASALANNTDLRAAAARVLELQAGFASARGSRWPQASVSVNTARTKTSFVLPTIGRTGIYSTTYSDDLSISYQVDLFGRLARTRQAAWAELLSAQASRDAVLHTVVAEVVRGRVQVASLQHQLALAQSTQHSWETTAHVVEDRYQLGLVDASEHYLTQQSLAAAEASVADLEQAVSQARHGLDVLVGRRPGTGNPLPMTLPLAPELGPVPLGLPAQLLDRRPDLVSARMQFAAATARVGVALANLYPDLTLSLSGGSRSDTPSDLLSTNGSVYSAVANVLAPLFRAGQLRAEVRAARARQEQVAATYCGAVLRALGEVENALVATATFERQLDARRRQYSSALAAEELSRSRYNAGTGDLLQLLVADRARTTAEQALITTRTAGWEVRIALILALGGDWIQPVSEPNPSAERQAT